jgi:carboxyl-terminal processing protease
MNTTTKAIIVILVVLGLCAGMLGFGFVAGYTVADREILSSLGIKPASQTPTASQTSGDPQRQLSLFWEAWDLLNEDFYGELPDAPETSRAAVRGLLQSLGDPNTALLDPTEAKMVREDMSGQFEGIGASVRTDENGYFTIIQPYEGSPAAKAGLLPGDIVLEVDGLVVQGLSTTEVISHIRGPKGSQVKLYIYRPGTQERLTISVTRDRIEIQNIEVKLLNDSIGYIRLREFNAMSADQVHQALKSTLALRPTGLILDLRGNPGGLLEAAVQIGSEFVGTGNITEERRKDGSGETFPARRGGLATGSALPLIILVNAGSASASEIVAGAVQDTGRGQLVGQKTYGKGSVQIPQTLSDGSQLRITVAHWFTPKGRDISKEGLTPDVEVALTAEDYSAGRDPQLERALQLLTEGAGNRTKS